MKFFKKKGTGWEWYTLLAVFVASIGIWIFYSNINVFSPKDSYRGEFSIKLMELLQKENGAQQKIDLIMEDIGKRSITKLSKKDIVQKKSCGEYLGYKLLNDINSESCIDEDFNQKKEYEKVFGETFDKIGEKLFDNLDFSNVNYVFSVNEENENVFIQGITSDKLSAPLMSKNRKIGTVFLNPSFRTKINYDFNEYSKITQKINELINKCKNENNVEQCIEKNKNNIFIKKDGLELMDSCETEEKEEFLKFVEYFGSCSKSEDKNCICAVNKPSGEGEFKILKEEGDVIISSDINGKEIKEEISDADLASDSYVFLNKGGTSFLHKDNEGKILASGYWKANECKLKTKTKFRFCVKSDNNKFYGYDSSGKQILRDIIYKFALQFGEEEAAESEEQVSLEQERILIYPECKEKEKTLELAKKIEDKLQDANAQVVLIRNSDECKLEAANIDIINGLTEPEEFTSLIVISVENEEKISKGMVEHYTNSINGEVMSYLILNRIKNIDGFSENLNPNNVDILSKTEPRATKITFTDKQIEDTDKYAEPISSGLVDYINVKKREMPFEYYDVEKPINVKKGIVDLEIVWDTAKQQGVNYYLLSSEIQTESSFVDLNQPGDGKAHGLGQQFVAAITDIHPDLSSNFPELKDKTPGEIYENILTSNDEESLKIQTTATALYLKWIKEELARRGKPTDTKTIVRAYHDGVGNIREDGTSKLAEDPDEAKRQEAIEYYPTVKSHHDRFTTMGLA